MLRICSGPVCLALRSLSGFAFRIIAAIPCLTLSVPNLVRSRLFFGLGTEFTVIQATITLALSVCSAVAAARVNTGIQVLNGKGNHSDDNLPRSVGTLRSPHPTKLGTCCPSTPQLALAV